MLPERLSFLLIAFFMFNASASVRVVHLNPPLGVAAGDRGANLADGKLVVDLNSDGIPELQILGSSGGITAFYDSPTRVVTTNTVAAIPFGTMIGTNLPSELRTSKWDTGGPVSTNSEFRVFGSRQTLILTTLMAPRQPGPAPIQIATGGPVSPPSSAAGDMVGKEGVIAMEFYINGQPHYGYIAFDFRSALGTGGKILGWAWETEPNVAITANRID